MNDGSNDKKQLARIALDQRREYVQKPLVSEEDAPVDLEALKRLSEQHGVSGIDLSQVCIRLKDLDLIPREIAEQQGIMPVLARGDRLFVAMISPGDRNIVDELEFVTGKKVFPYVALPDELRKVVRTAYDMKNRGEEFFIARNCPEETMRRMGALPPEPTKDVPGSLPNSPQEEPSVVMDEASNRAASRADLSVTGFPNTSGDLSVVTDLPGEGSGNTKPPPPGARTVLVVDDERDIRNMLSRLLTRRGFHVYEAERGLQALRLVKEKVPSIIILDAMLPEVHGFEIARRIKGSKRYGHIPIIMISAVYRGWRYAEDIKSKYGVEGYVEKPFRISDILRVINEIVEKQSKSPPPTVEDRKRVSALAEQALAAGVAAYKAGDIDKAIEHLQRGIEIDPLAYRLHFHLGLLWGKKNMIYEAIQALERALDINARHFPAMKNLAVLYQKAGFKNKAIETWERAIAIAPDEATKQSIKELLLELL